MRPPSLLRCTCAYALCLMRRRQGLDQALCCAPLASALHRLRDTEAPGSRLQALARSALTDMAALARVMAPGT